ncbi:MAG TPA: NHL repeat-containing protein, partial [Isosphaeraceae bacterium]
MAKVTKTIHVRVLTFDPAQDKMIPVPGAKLVCKHSRIFRDPTLSTGSPTTDPEGRADVPLVFDEEDENSLNPYFEITLPTVARTVPAGAAAARQLDLPGAWTTRHDENRRLPRIADFSNPDRPLELFVGLDGHLRVACADFDPSGIRNPMALPEKTLSVHLADVDFFFLPDDTLKGRGFDPRANTLIAAGPGDAYPYFDAWPTAPFAFDAATPPEPRAWLDPPGAPVGMLGGGSFAQAGPLAVDAQGFVFLIDGTVVRRFYPDGTLCETIFLPVVASPRVLTGLALDQFRHLYVADAANNEVVILLLDENDGGSGTYRPATVSSLTAGFSQPAGMAVVAHPAVDGEELLAVADAGNHRVQVFQIRYPGASAGSLRSLLVQRPVLNHLLDFGTAGTGAGQFQAPVGVAADRRRRLFVCDRANHRVSRWRFDPAGPAYRHEPAADIGLPGGASGAGSKEFNAPEALALDPKHGFLYVADAGNRRVQRLDAQTGAFQVNWVPAIPGAASPLAPTAVAVDRRGEVYVADTANHRVVRGTPFDAAGAPQPDATAPRIVGTPWTPRAAPVAIPPA